MFLLPSLEVITREMSLNYTDIYDIKCVIINQLKMHYVLGDTLVHYDSISKQIFETVPRLIEWGPNKSFAKYNDDLLRAQLICMRVFSLILQKKFIIMKIILILDKGCLIFMKHLEN